MFITLSQLKEHLNIDKDYTDDDLYLLDLITVAEDAVRLELDVDYMNIQRGGILPPSVVHAILLLAGNLYMTREPVNFGAANKIPYTFEYLMQLNKNYENKIF